MIRGVVSAVPEHCGRPGMLESAVSVIPRRDLWERMTSLSLAVVAPDMEQDEGVLVEVTSTGPGRWVDHEFKPCPVSVGDICWVNGAFTGRMINKHGVPHWTHSSDYLLARVQDMAEDYPLPLEDRFVTKANEKWSQLAAADPRTVIEKDGLPTITVPSFGPDGEEGWRAGGGRDPERIVYEEVVAVGPDTPEEIRVGQLVAFSKGRTATNITIRGQKRCLVTMSVFSCVIAQPEERPKGV